MEKFPLTMIQADSWLGEEHQTGDIVRVYIKILQIIAPYSKQ